MNYYQFMDKADLHIEEINTWGMIISGILIAILLGKLIFNKIWGH